MVEHQDGVDAGLAGGRVAVQPDAAHAARPQRMAVVPGRGAHTASPNCDAVYNLPDQAHANPRPPLLRSATLALHVCYIYLRGCSSNNTFTTTRLSTCASPPSPSPLQQQQQRDYAIPVARGYVPSPRALERQYAADRCGWASHQLR